MSSTKKFNVKDFVVKNKKRIPSVFLAVILAVFTLLFVILDIIEGREVEDMNGRASPVKTTNTLFRRPIFVAASIFFAGFSFILVMMFAAYFNINELFYLLL
jgi:hypothetical protein